MKPTGNAVLDSFPSDNGVYLRPIPIDISTFTIKEFPTINATIRHEKPKGNETLAEAEEDENNNREKRDLFSNLYEERIPFKISAKFGEEKPGLKESESIDFGVDKVVTEKSNNNETDITTTTTVTPTTTTISISNLEESTTTQPVTTTTLEVTTPDPNQIIPLEWYAGFQPLLLTLPEGQSVKTTHWMSLYDHKKQVSSCFNYFKSKF